MSRQGPSSGVVSIPGTGGTVIHQDRTGDLFDCYVSGTDTCDSEYDDDIIIVKLGSRSKVYLKSLKDLDLELEAIIAMSPPTHPLNFSVQNNIEISSCMNSLII